MPAIPSRRVARDAAARRPWPMRMMDVIIVDDEQAGRRTLREYCEAESDLRVVGEFGDGAAALAAIRSQPPQLLFLDIQMDPLNGIELARALEPSQLPSLVFVTAYDTYALEAFEVCAVDYLLKPFDQERFRKTLARVRPRHAKSGADERQALLAGLLAQLERGARDRRRGAAAPAGGVRRPPARARCRPGGNDRGGSQLCGHPGGQGQLSRPQHSAAGGTRAALAAHAAHQPLLPGQYELRQRSESHSARRFHPGAGRRRHRDEQRGISRQGQGILEHA